MVKPEPEVFRHLLATFNLRAEQSVFIDDLPANIESARQVGAGSNPGQLSLFELFMKQIAHFAEK